MKNQERIEKLEAKIQSQKERIDKLKKDRIRLVREIRRYKMKLDIEAGKKIRDPNDPLTIDQIMAQYPVSRKTIDRYREKGMYPPINSKEKKRVVIIRKEFLKFWSGKND